MRDAVGKVNWWLIGAAVCYGILLGQAAGVIRL